MKHTKLYLLLLAGALLAGCARTRSISNSEYQEGPDYLRPHVGSDGPRRYQGELSEYDVLGISRGPATESDIQQALDQSKRVRLRPDSSILLIQSGAAFPDGPMVKELSKHYRVVPFSGVPELIRKDPYSKENSDSESLSRTLRLAAARTGAEVIVCYWGILESKNQDFATKHISWLPVVSWVVPDAKQHMRIRLKIATIDVRSGSWSVISTEPFEEKRISVGPRRAVADQRLVESLKLKAYQAGVDELVKLSSTSAAAPAPAERTSAVTTQERDLHAVAR